MSDFDVSKLPLPTNLTADQKQVVVNMRQALHRMLLELCPRSTDKGLSELEKMFKMAEKVFGEVIPMSDALFNATVNNRADSAITDAGMTDFLSMEFLNRFSKWSKDELLLLMVVIHLDRAISERAYRGLPKEEPK